MTSPQHSLKAGLERLGTASLAVGVAGAIAASRAQPRGGVQLNATGRLLLEIRQVAEAPAAGAADAKAGLVARHVDAVLSEVEQLAAVADWPRFRALAGACAAGAEPAQLFVSTGATYTGGGHGDVTLQIWGNQGGNHFSFASGTAQVHIVRAINTFTAHLGMSASVSLVDANRLVISSTEAGADGFVRVRQTDGFKPVIFEGAASQIGFSDRKAWGTNAITASAQRPQ